MPSFDVKSLYNDALFCKCKQEAKVKNRSVIGAFVLQKLVLQFQKYHSGDHGNNNDKEINNIVILLAFLYSFKVSLHWDFVCFSAQC